MTRTHLWRLFDAITWPPRYKRLGRRNRRLRLTMPHWRSCKMSSSQSKSSWMKRGSTAMLLPKKSLVSSTISRSVLLSSILRNGDWLWMETCTVSWCVSCSARKNCQACLILFDLDWLVGERVWKPSIKYFDFFAQSTKQSQVKQVFPFVKVRLLSLVPYSHPLVCFSALAFDWCIGWLHKAHYRQRWWTWTL